MSSFDPNVPGSSQPPSEPESGPGTGPRSVSTPGVAPAGMPSVPEQPSNPAGGPINHARPSEPVASRLVEAFDDKPEVARTYATALLGAVQPSGPEAVESALADLETFVIDVLQAHPVLRSIFAAPAVTEEQRDQVLTRLLEGRAHPSVVNLARVLNRNGRFAIIDSVASQARLAWEGQQNRRRVQVISAVSLEDDQRESVLEKARTLLGAEPILEQVVDPAILGGLILQVGDTRYDASVRAQLNQLHHELMERKSHVVESQ